MQYYDDTSERLHYLETSIAELEKLNKQLAKLLVKKDELTNMVIAALEHNHEGQKTYEHSVWRIEVKTPYVYSLNKQLYESKSCEIPKEFNPIKESLSYSIDKRVVEDYLNKAPEDVREILIDLIEKRPGKASIVIKERV